MKNLFISAILCVLTIFSGLSQTVGDWKMHHVFYVGDQPYNIIDTKDKVYMLTSFHLSAYDKENDETLSYNMKNDLSDVLVDNIFYNFQKEYLVVVYTNSNIDVINKDGSVTNIPDLKNVVLQGSKKINDITFVGDNMYVATDFGFMLINDKKMEVRSSYFYDKKVNAATECGGYILLCLDDAIYSSPVDAVHTSFSNFTVAFADLKSPKIYRLSDNTIFTTSGWNYTFVVGENGKLELISTINQTGFRSAQYNEDGDVVFQSINDNSMYVVGVDGKRKSVMQIPPELGTGMFVTYTSDYGEVWNLDLKGVRELKIGSSEVTVLKDYFRPNASNVWYPDYLIYNKASDMLLAANCSATSYKDEYNELGAISMYDGSSWDVAVEPYNFPTTVNNDGLLRSVYSPVFDPENPDVFYFGTWYEGLVRVEKGKITHIYNHLNAPYYLYADFCVTVSCAAFDKDMNLWTINAMNNEEIFVLPRAKQGIKNTTKNDWISVALPGFLPTHRAEIFMTSSDLKILQDDRYGSPLYFLDSKGTITGSDDRHKSYNELFDQDGKNFVWHRIICFKEDHNGSVWMGTDNGVVEFNPKKAFDSNFRVNRIKVPRNDGTNFADYLLENESILSIEVDGANRKWIGTKESGLFLVSADGSEILEHFTSENSYLPSNQVIEVCCNPTNNSVYVGTNKGLVEYLSDAYPSSENYDDVYAYPNPVRPDFTGLVTVRGLMDNTLVKIADAAGNVVYSGMSTGGMFTWNACNSNGEKVKTGVYYVLASQNSNNKSSGVVTKIMVIK